MNYGTHVGDGQASGSLPAYNFAKSSFVFDDAIGDTHLSAQGRQEQNQLKIEME